MKTSFSRRQFAKLALKTGAGLAVLGAIDGFVVEPHLRMTTERIDIKLARIPAAKDAVAII